MGQESRATRADASLDFHSVHQLPQGGRPVSLLLPARRRLLPPSCTRAAGMDLNRTWDKPDKVLHPTIWHTRALVQRLASTGRLALFCDLHGHSRREVPPSCPRAFRVAFVGPETRWPPMQDAFFYGCDPAPAAGAEAKAPALVLEARRDDTVRPFPTLPLLHRRN